MWRQNVRCQRTSSPPTAEMTTTTTTITDSTASALGRLAIACSPAGATARGWTFGATGVFLWLGGCAAGTAGCRAGAGAATC